MAVERQILQIDPLALRRSAKSLVTMRDSMKAELDNAKVQMEEVSSKYHGNISRENASKFNEYSLEFDRFCGKIDQYVSFLINTAVAYEKTDDTNGSSSSQAQRPGTFTNTVQ